MKLTGAGATETIREALQSYRQAHACDALRKLRGKVKFSMDLKELRKDRDLSRFVKKKTS